MVVFDILKLGMNSDKKLQSIECGNEKKCFIFKYYI